MTDTPPPGPERKPDLRLLRNELDQAEAASVAPPHESAERPPDGGAPPRKPPNPDRAPGEIYRGCPVHALGVHGEVFYYQDILGQLCAVTNHTKDRMRGIFGGRSDLLIEQFPQYNKSGGVSGWAQEGAATAMMRAAAEKGVWDAGERVRGLGAWPDQEGGVALHCGDAILHRGRWRAPGLIDGYVYPSAPKIPRPLDAADAMSAESLRLVSELHEILGTWSWQRRDVDAWLLAGWLGAACFAGALRWRPMTWITGDAGTGKSTLQELILHLLGGEQSVLASSDPTEAGIRQVLAAGSQSTIPVLLDEMEAEENNQRILSLIKLARQAASGGVILRGGNDHRSHSFKVRSTFLFSSILVPPLQDQDVSRIALLELNELDRTAPAPNVQPKVWGRMGRALSGRVLAQWPRLAETLERYRRALNRHGHSARGCDQYGVLLAMADLIMHDEAPDEARCEEWGAKLSSVLIVTQTDQLRDWQRMLNHMLGQTIEPFRSGQRYPLGRWILAAAGLRDTPQPGDARLALPSYGLKVEGRGQDALLVIANTHPGLGTIFAGTRWYAGSGQRGVWSQAVKRIPGSIATGARSFEGVSSRAYTVPLKSMPQLFGDEDAPEASQTPEAPSYQDIAVRTFTPDDFA